jgi:hypothetical protein
MNFIARLETIATATFMAILSILSFVKDSLYADVKGKLDLGPTYAHIDILESGHTVRTMDLPAIKGEANINFYKGFCLKPNFLYGSNKGYLFNAGIGLGYFIPLDDHISITPSVGWSFTDLRTTINLPIFNLRHLKERFRSNSPYIGVEVTYRFSPCLRATAAYQYAWSRTHTIIKHLASTHSHTEGPNYSFMVERDINSKWSVYIGGAYNISLTKEKHGLRAYGAKIGIVRWFGFESESE